MGHSPLVRPELVASSMAVAPIGEVTATSGTLGGDNLAFSKAEINETATVLEGEVDEDMLV